jgi:hypothetical protein
MINAAWHEVRDAVEAMIENLGKIAERNPEASVKGDDFDALLKRAQATFPNSAAIHDVKPIGSMTTLADLFSKLSVVQGAVKAAFTVYQAESIRRANEENARRHRGGLR